MDIKEYITFGDFNSKEMGLYLEAREAPTPDEKTITESIPGMQGVLDFSEVFGERVFENREITYQFKLLNTPYETRKHYEQRIKQQVMPIGKSVLFDTFSKNHYWVGKCKSVKVVHDAKKRNFIVTFIFDCYPFMYSQKDYFDDVWDTFSFDEDVSCFTKYDVRGSKIIVLYNSDNTSLSPEVIVDSPFTIVDSDGLSHRFSPSTSTDFTFQLKLGVNTLTIQGNGLIAFHFRVEVMA